MTEKMNNCEDTQEVVFLESGCISCQKGLSLYKVFSSRWFDLVGLEEPI